MRASLLSLSLSFSFALALPAPVAAQDDPPPHVGDCGGAENGASIRGVLVDSTGTPTRALRVDLFRSRCGRVSTDSAGRFLLRNVPPGRYEIVPVQLPRSWSNRLRSRAVEVAPGQELALEMRLERATHLTFCQDEPACAPHLEVDTVATARLTDDERLREAVLRTTIALVGLMDGARKWPPAWTACLHDQPPAVVAVLRARFDAVVEDGCALTSGTSVHRELRHTPSGSGATSIHVFSLTVDGGRAVARNGHYRGPLSATEYLCVFDRVDGAWVARSCDLESIS